MVHISKSETLAASHTLVSWPEPASAKFVGKDLPVEVHVVENVRARARDVVDVVNGINEERDVSIVHGHNRQHASPLVRHGIATRVDPLGARERWRKPANV